MATLTIALPDDALQDLSERAAEARHATPSDYVLALIEADRQGAAQARLEELLLEGLDSGEPIELTPAWLEDQERRLRERFGPDARRGDEAAR